MLAFAAGCSSSTGGPGPTTSTGPTTPGSQDPIEAILSQKLTQPLTQCTFVASTGIMTVSVNAETAIISKRATDSNIVQNGYDCDVPVGSAKLKGIVILGHSGDDTVILDYTNGLFATGTASTPGIAAVDMGGSGGHDMFGIRGTSTADTVTFGSDGVSVNSDKFKDITFKVGGEPDTYAVSLAAGDDKWSAAGTAAVGLAGNYAGGKPIAVYGGAGKDTFDEGATSTPKESLHGGDDADTLTYAGRASTAPVKITMGTGTTDDGEYNFGTKASVENDDIDVDIENVVGTPGNDDISDWKGSIAVTLNGGAGNDKLQGGTGNDTLNGGDGDDVFYEGNVANGADTFNGGAGTDTVDYSVRKHGVTVTMDGTKANDGDTALNEGDNVKADVENCKGSWGSDTITGNSSNNVLTGGLGADVLNGGDGDDTFNEGDADRAADDIDNDTIACGKGVDTVSYKGRTHALTIKIDGLADSGDMLVTGAGGAVYPYNDGGVEGGTDAGGGGAAVDAGAGDGGDAGGPALPGEQDLIGTDCENATGGNGVNHITGSSGPNELTGGTSADVIIGGDGDDTIDGGGGADTLNGGLGGGDICFNTSGTKLACEL